MTREQFDNLNRGDIVRNVQSGNSYVVESKTVGGELLLVLIIHASNPSEWEVVIAREK